MVEIKPASLNTKIIGDFKGCLCQREIPGQQRTTSAFTGHGRILGKSWDNESGLRIRGSALRGSLGRLTVSQKLNRSEISGLRKKSTNSRRMTSESFKSFEHDNKVKTDPKIVNIRRGITPVENEKRKKYLNLVLGRSFVVKDTTDDEDYIYIDGNLLTSYLNNNSSGIETNDAALSAPRNELSFGIEANKCRLQKKYNDYRNIQLPNLIPRLFT